MDKVTINNQVVSMRKFVKQAKTHVINKCVKQIKLLQNRKGNEAQVVKCKRKAERMLSEVSIIKKIKPDFISKLALSKVKDWHSVLLQKNIPLEERCVALLANYEPVQKEVEKFSKIHSNLIPRIRILLDSIGNADKKDQKKKNQIKKMNTNTKVSVKTGEKSSRNLAGEEKNEKCGRNFQAESETNEEAQSKKGVLSNDESEKCNAVSPKDLKCKSVGDKFEGKMIGSDIDEMQSDIDEMESDIDEMESEQQEEQERNFSLQKSLKKQNTVKKINRSTGRTKDRSNDKVGNKKLTLDTNTGETDSEEEEAQNRDQRTVFKKDLQHEQNTKDSDSDKLSISSNSSQEESEDEQESNLIQQQTFKKRNTTKLNKGVGNRLNSKRLSVEKIASDTDGDSGFGKKGKQNQQINFKKQNSQAKLNIKEILNESLSTGSDSSETDFEDDKERDSGTIQQPILKKLSVAKKLPNKNAPNRTAPTDKTVLPSQSDEEKDMMPLKETKADKLPYKALDIQAKLQAIADNAKRSTAYLPNPESKLSVEERNRLKAIKVLNLDELQDLDEIPIKEDTSTGGEAEETQKRRKDPFFLTDEGDVVSESDEESKTDKPEAHEFPSSNSKTYGNFDHEAPKPQFNRKFRRSSFPENQSNFNDYKRNKSSNEFNDRNVFKRKAGNDGFNKSKKFNSFEKSKFGDRNESKPFNKDFKAGNFKQMQFDHSRKQSSTTGKKMDQPFKKDKTDDKPLHPSWEAKKKLKEATKTKFQGKRIVFN